MHSYLIEMLICPGCHGSLEWRIDERLGERIEAAEAVCTACGAAYPVRDGIGLFLTPDLPRDDLWERVDSGLIQHLAAHPELERRLLDAPLAALAPADRFFRALLLEARGRFTEAKQAEDAAQQDLYTAGYLQCWRSQVDYTVDRLAATDGPIVDLASGRAYLVETMVRRLERPVVATDFSPGVLRRNRDYLQNAGFYDYVSLLAFDARATPFHDGAVATLTTNQGLPNIREPGRLLEELRRIVAGAFLAISHFYPEDDHANGTVIRELGLEALLYRRAAVQGFAAAGWQVEVGHSCVSEARPTPPSAVLEGARVDGMPVAETTLEWCTLIAT